MLIIGESGNKGIVFKLNSTVVHIETDNENYILKVNNEEYARSNSYSRIKLLLIRLINFSDKYHRKEDTFDIRRELKIIDKELEKGKYSDINQPNSSTSSFLVGYPTYTS